MNWGDECSCIRPIEPWREVRPSRDCPVHGDVDERVDQKKESK